MDKMLTFNLHLFTFQLADLLERDVVTLATLESTDNGMPFTFAQFTISFSAKLLRYYAGLADKVQGHTIPAGELFIYMFANP